jgi:hypothetical protein
MDMSRAESYEGIHRSHDASLAEVRQVGQFGGIFASVSGGMHGEYVYRVTSPRHLENYALNYEIEGAWEVALDVCSGDESLAEAIMTTGCEIADDNDGEAGWEAQRLRGVLALRLGYTSIEMRDETGHSVLCLPGCAIERETK